ncbi:hypothetical protein MHYP_G00126790 [Metynnis hypsauchen]
MWTFRPAAQDQTSFELVSATRDAARGGQPITDPTGELPDRAPAYSPVLREAFACTKQHDRSMPDSKIKGKSVGVWSVKTDLMDCVPPAPPHPGSSSGQAQNGTPLAPVSQGAREHSVLSDHTGVPVNMGYKCEISRCESCPVRKRHCYVCIHALAQAGHRMACWDSGPASLGRAWEGGGAAAHWDRPTLIYTPILLPLCLDRGGAKSVPDGLSC